MRRQQAENGNNGSSGSGSSGNNSQMQQFMKKMQSQGPDTLEARPRNANYYIRKEDSSSRPGGFSMSSFSACSCSIPIPLSSTRITTSPFSSKK